MMSVRVAALRTGNEGGAELGFADAHPTIAIARNRSAVGVVRIAVLRLSGFVHESQRVAADQRPVDEDVAAESNAERPLA